MGKLRVMFSMLSLSLAMSCSDTKPTSSSPPPDSPGQRIPQIGLNNLGNTCFANASLNLLLSASNVQHSLNSAIKTSSGESKEAFLARKKLQESLKSLSLARLRGDPKICNELSAFFDAFESARKIIKGSKRVGSIDKIRREQADASEFLGDVLELLDAEGPSLFGILDFVDGTQKVLPVENQKLISLHLSEDSTSIQELLNAFSAPEFIGGDNQIENLQGLKMDSQRRNFINNPPPSSLILSLKRFSYTTATNASERLDTEISFENELSLEATDEKNPSKTFTHTYVIKSIILHQGSTPRGGHYYAYVFDTTTKRWTKFDDTFVSVVDEKEVRQKAGSDGYVYLYEMKPL